MDIDFLILADWAEVLGGKLYLQGGGWDRLAVASSFPTSRNVAVAAGILIPWEETNQRYRLELRILDEDNQQAILGATADLETGRPAGIPAGSTQRLLMALNGPVTFARPGQFVVAASIDGAEKRRVPFTVQGR